MNGAFSALNCKGARKRCQGARWKCSPCPMRVLYGRRGLVQNPIACPPRAANHPARRAAATGAEAACPDDLRCALRPIHTPTPTHPPDDLRCALRPIHTPTPTHPRMTCAAPCAQYTHPHQHTPRDDLRCALRPVHTHSARPAHTAARVAGEVWASISTRGPP